MSNSKVSASSHVTQLADLHARIDQMRLTIESQSKEITRLRDLSETDSLTGIGNRRAFDKEIRRRFAEFQRHGREFCLMIVDVDGFKQINDRYGHVAGDRLLQSLARIVVENMRETDIVSRIGGDEFAIVLPGLHMEQAEHAARRLVNETVSVVQTEMDDVPVGLSIGLSQSEPGRSIEQMMELADRAMYRAKEQGGDRFVSVSEPS